MPARVLNDRAVGCTQVRSAEEGACTRYRPVMMTAVAFILGVVPLVIATGAGAGARQSIGTTVFGGMVLASFVGVLFVPPLFVKRQHGHLPANNMFVFCSEERFGTGLFPCSVAPF
jgi:multidrug efflux pump subunit AcrB